MITRSSQEKLTPEEVKNYITAWLMSKERDAILEYKSYYMTKNEELARKVKDRAFRNKTPNYFIPSAYYSTLVDTMAGYMFQNVKYVDEGGGESIIEVLNNNYVEIKDMHSGTNALTYNRGIEYVYTQGEANSIEYKFTSIPTENVVLIYNEDIEPELFCAIRLYETEDKKIEWMAQVIYFDETVTYELRGDGKSVKNLFGASQRNIKEVPDSRKPLLFTEVPIVVYNTEIISKQSSFHSVLYYIQALDWLLTGNTNELDRLVDALLVLGKKVKDEDLKHSDEWKALMGYKAEDRAEYINKEMSPEFRKYVSELLIQEIHKHSHIIDWYSPDTGVTGAASGRALRTRLFDMDMFSQRIEKVYRLGAEKRLRLISQLLNKAEGDTGEVSINFIRTVPSDFEEKVDALMKAEFLSRRTKVEEAGFDWEKELERIEEEKTLFGVEEPFSLEDRADEE